VYVIDAFKNKDSGTLINDSYKSCKKVKDKKNESYSTIVHFFNNFFSKNLSVIFKDSY